MDLCFPWTVSLVFLFPDTSYPTHAVCLISVALVWLCASQRPPFVRLFPGTVLPIRAVSLILVVLMRATVSLVSLRGSVTHREDGVGPGLVQSNIAQGVEWYLWCAFGMMYLEPRRVVIVGRRQRHSDNLSTVNVSHMPITKATWCGPRLFPLLCFVLAQAITRSALISRSISLHAPLRYPSP